MNKDDLKTINSIRYKLNKPVIHDTGGMTRHQQRTEKTAILLKRLIDESSWVSFKSFIQVGVCETTEARLMKKWFPEITILGADPVPCKRYPGTFEQIAISDYEGEIGFQYRPDRKRSEVNTKSTKRIKCTTLDAFTESHKPAPPFILWMDCEDCETYALKGGKKTIAKSNFVITEIEAGCEASRKTHGILASNGFLLASNYRINYFYVRMSTENA
jgi:hypothetical protein